MTHDAFATDDRARLAPRRATCADGSTVTGDDAASRGGMIDASFAPMDAHVGSLMSTGLVSIRAEASIAQAAKTLAAHPFSALPVVNADDVPIGILTETDLMRLLLTGATTATVSEFMSAPVEMVDELDDIDDVMGRMRARRIHHMPVVRNGKLVGMVTPGDIVRWFVTNRLGSLTRLA